MTSVVHTFLFLGEKRMTIIVLQGKNGCGKTTTIKKLVEKLIADGKGQFVCCQDKVKAENNKDFCVPVLYNGVLLAITTRGDTEQCIKPPYEKYNGFAKIFVCAAHEDGDTAALVNCWSKQQQVVCVKKAKTDVYEEREKANEQKAQELYNLVLQVVKEVNL